MAAKTAKKSPIRKGTQTVMKKESAFLQVKAGEPLDIVPLVGGEGMISVDQHAIWLDAGNSPIFVCVHGTGEKCPGCDLKNKPKFRGFLPVWNKDQGVKIFAFGIMLARALAEAEDAIDGGLKGKVLRLKKEGTGMKTTYTLTPTGRNAAKDIDGLEVPNVEEHLGPLDREGILNVLIAAGVDVDGIITPEEAKRLTVIDEAQDGIEEEPSTTGDEEDDWDDVS